MRSAWNSGTLVFCLGAGVSLPYGLPSWNDLVLTLLLDEYASRFKDLWSHYRRPFGSWLVETFGLGPTQLARLSQRKFNSEPRGMRFPDYVRDQLRGQLRQPTGPTALEAVADLIAGSERAGRRVPLVITFNFDDLLEQELRKRNVDVTSIFGPDRNNKGALIVLHPHGYLPLEGSVPKGSLIFSEQEYHELSYSSIHWAQVEMLSALRCFTLLFVGLSMTDPNLRRFLDATSISGRTRHFLFRQNYSLTPVEKTRAARTVTDRVRAQPLTPEELRQIKDPQQFEEAIEELLRVPRSYDKALFKDMGVDLIWYNRHEDVPTLLRQISPS